MVTGNLLPTHPTYRQICRVAAPGCARSESQATHLPFSSPSQNYNAGIAPDIGFSELLVLINNGLGGAKKSLGWEEVEVGGRTFVY